MFKIGYLNQHIYINLFNIKNFVTIVTGSGRGIGLEIATGFYKYGAKVIRIDLNLKKNKLPADKHAVDFQLEYGKATMEIHKDSIDKGDSVLLIDDLIATGGTAGAAAKLIEISNGSVAGFIFVINLFDLGGAKNLTKKGMFWYAKIKWKTIQIIDKQN